MTHKDVMIILETMGKLTHVPDRGFTYITATGKITAACKMTNCTLEKQKISINLFADFAMISFSDDLEYVRIFFSLESSTLIKYGKRYTFRNSSKRVVVQL